jgi:hypothetical protein
MIGAPRAIEPFERGHLELEHLAVEEDQRAECLVLGGCGDVAAHGEVVEKGRDVVASAGRAGGDCRASG